MRDGATVDLRMTLGIAANAAPKGMSEIMTLTLRYHPNGGCSKSQLGISLLRTGAWVRDPPGWVPLDVEPEWRSGRGDKCVRKSVFVVIVAGANAVLLPDVHAFGVSCGQAFGNYFMPARRAIDGMKYSGSHSLALAAIVESCKKVVDARKSIQDVRCADYPLFNGQVNHLIGECEFYLRTYGDTYLPKEAAGSAAVAPGSPQGGAR